MNDNLYGVTSTDEVQYDKQGLPVGTYKVMVIGESPAKDDLGLIVEYEIVDGEFKGRSGKQWLLTKHPNATTSSIAKQNLKRIADATGKPVTMQSPIKGRVLTLDVRQQKKNPDYTEIARYLPENHKVENAPF